MKAMKPVRIWSCLILALLTQAFNLGSVQAQVTFQKFYNNHDNDEGHDVIQDAEGNYIVAGQTNGLLGYNDATLTKFDYAGNEIWSKAFGTSNYDNAYTVLETSDTGYVIGGFLGANALLVKTNTQGDTMWTQTVGGGSQEVVRDVAKTQDGGYVATGYTTSFTCCLEDVLLFKVDSTGSLSWSRVFEFPANKNFGNSVEQTSDGGFIVAGQRGHWSSTSSSIMGFIKTDGSGNLQWTTAVHPDTVYPESEAHDVIETHDGGYLAVGRNGRVKHNYLVKLDQTGNALWTRTFASDSSSYARGYDLEQRPDSNLVVAGYDSKITSGTNTNFFVAELSRQADTIWSRGYPLQDWWGINPQKSYGMDLTDDGGIIATGYVDDNNYYDHFLVKADSMGISGCGDTGSFYTTTHPVTTSDSDFTQLDTMIQVNKTVQTQDFSFNPTTACADTCFVGAAFNASADSICLGDSVLFTDQSYKADSLEWYKNDMLVSTATNPKMGFDSLGTHFIRQIAIKGGCKDTAYASVTVSGVLYNKSIADISCAGKDDGSASVNVSDSTSPYSYQWSTGDTTSSIDSLSGGTYTLTISDSVGCTFADTITIEEPSSLTLSLSSTDATCDGVNDGSLTANVNGGTTPYSYQWSTGDTSMMIDSLPEGNYSVTVTDSNGCTISGSDTVGVSTSLSVSTSTTKADCGESNGSATVSVSGGNSPYSYVWSSGDTTKTADSLSAGSYTVQISDANGCEAFVSVSVNNAGGLTASVASVSDVSCPGGNDGSIDVNVSGGTTPYSYQWNNGDTTQDLSGIGGGSYDLQIMDADSCKTTLSVVVDEPAPLDLNLTATEASCDSSDGEVSVSVSGGTGPYSYQWSTGATTPSDSGLAAGDYSVTVTDSNGCIDSGLVMVSEKGGPSITLDAVNKTSCGASNGSVLISVSSGTPPYSYSWSNGDTTQDLTGASPGTYFVVVNDSSSCQAMRSFTIESLGPTQVPICVVSVDSTSEHNLVIWEEPSDPSIKAYNIYKESFQAGVYNKVATVPDSALSTYVDSNSNPTVRSYRYKVASVDSCGNEAPLSPKHKTIHLSATEGLNGEVDLIWDDYKGFSYSTFYIHRYTMQSGWKKLDSVPSTVHSYTDINAPISDTSLRYIVSVRPPSGVCTATRAKNYSNSISNAGNLMGGGKSDTSSSIRTSNEKLRTKLYPNPNQGSFTFEWKGMELRSIEIYDMLGEQVLRLEEGAIPSGRAGRLPIDLNDRGKGVYWLRIRGEGQEVQRSVMVE